MRVRGALILLAILSLAQAAAAQPAVSEGPPVIERLPALEPPEPTAEPDVEIPPLPGEELDADVAEEAAEELDAEEIPEPTYSWYELHYWFPPKLWEASVELGVNGSEGNSNTLNTSVGANAKRETERQIWELDFTYTNNTANSVETANQGLFTSHYDWLLPDSPLSVFQNSSLEFDRFRAFDIRWATNLGLSYNVIKTKSTKLNLRLGSGVSQEVGGPEERYVPEATYGLNFKHQLNKLQKITAKVDYFPDWQDYGDYRINSDLSWEILLSEPMDLSLKLGILDRYDSTPEGAEANDLNYVLLLLWKL